MALVTLRGANLGGIDLSKVDLRDADLSMADLTAAVLRDARLDGATVRETDLTKADLRGASLGGVDLREATLKDTRLDLPGAVLPRRAVRRGRRALTAAVSRSMVPCSTQVADQPRGVTWTLSRRRHDGAVARRFEHQPRRQSRVITVVEREPQ